MKEYLRKNIRFQRRKDRGRKNRAAGKTGGFTLVELVVVLAIIAILAGVAAAGLIEYQQYAIYKKNNEYARSIFNATQASLARMKASGTLSDLNEELKGLVNAQPPMKGIGTKETCGVIPDKDGTLHNNMYYLMITKDDYSGLKSAKNTAAGLLYEILSPYILDDGVYNAAISVVLDPGDGVVQEVFYSDRANSLVYKDEVTSSGEMAIGVTGKKRGDEYLKYRKDVGLGYYGTSTSKAAPGTPEKLVISHVELINHEVLELVWTLNNDQQSNSSACNYKIQLFENETGISTPRVEILVKGGAEGEGALRSYKNNGYNAVPATVTFYDDLNGNGTPLFEPLDMYFECYLTADTTNTTNTITSVHLILDAVDLGLVGKTMKGLGLVEEQDGQQVLKTGLNVIQNLYQENDEGRIDPARGSDGGFLYGSYSIHRLGLEFDSQIYAKVSASHSEFQESIERTSNKEHPYFESLSEKSGRYEVKIGNARHLFNATLLEEATAYETSETKIEKTYIQTRDFAWSNADWSKAPGESAPGGETEGIKEGENAPAGEKEEIKEGESAPAAETEEIEQGESAPAAETDMLSGGYVYAKVDGNNYPTRVTAADEVLHFRSFERLHASTVYDGQGNNISGLAYNYKSLPDALERLNNGQLQNLGFIRINEGQVKDLTLSHIEVCGAGIKNEETNSYGEGVDFVGAISGRLINNGKLDNCSVTEGQITGRLYVGGLCGAMDMTGAVSDVPDVSKGENGAQVQGWAYVGGIAGGTYPSSVPANKQCKISSSVNTGAVRGLNFNSNVRSGIDGSITIPYEISCLGGIIGYGRNINVENCESSPQEAYEEKNLLKRLEENKKINTTTKQNVDALNLTGNMVGGIAGYVCGNSSITGCNTKEGYVVGRNFVGGIIGYYDGDRSDGKGAANGASVIGLSFVGGITGSNADFSEVSGQKGMDFLAELNVLFSETQRQESDILTMLAEQALKNQNATPPDTDSSEMLNWINRGIAVAAYKYAGGITGFNTGKIIGCKSEIDTSVKLDEKKNLAAGLGSDAYYVGGLAGYNNGEICGTTTEEDESIPVVSVVTGAHYVGGLVGCLDVKGSLDGYALNGGYIYGTNFVGGVIGLNFSSKIFGPTFISNPNRVEGRYFTGGVIGANFAVVEEGGSTSPLRFTCSTDNFLGSVVADGAFTGGFIGANLLLGPIEGSQTDAISKCFLDILKKGSDLQSAVPALTSLMNGGEDNETNSGSLIVPKDVSMRIAGTTDTPLSSHLMEIKGGVYVGGILGFNSSCTKLDLRYIENKTPVTAQESIKDNIRAGAYAQGRLDADGMPLVENVTYSYAGGILGLVSDQTTVFACKNTEQGRISAKGTYHGNIAEINEGTIQNCSTGSAGNANSSYVGGIVGINGKKQNNQNVTLAVIEGCTVDGTIRGANYIGGIAAENYGMIRAYSEGVEASPNENETKNTVEGRVIGTGSYVGGIVARNYKDALISGVRIEDTASVEGVAICVGGVAGSNGADISAITDVENNGIRVSGSKDVGGIIGRQEEAQLIASKQEISALAEVTVNVETLLTPVPEPDDSEPSFINRATVIAVRGNVGGIVGSATSKLTLNGCQNYGDVEAQQSGNAGGITAVLKDRDSIIVNCENHGNVTALNGEAGGIAAENYGTIQSCQVSGTQKDNVWVTITIESKKNAGGFCAENHNKIWADINKLNQLSHVVITTNIQSGSGSSIGGFVGYNVGEVQGCKVEKDNAVTVKMQSIGSNVGGVAGYNAQDGRIGIEEDNGEKMEIYGVLFDVPYSGNVGGIAGVNEGKIYNMDCQSISSPNASKPLEFAGGNGYGYGGIAGINRNGGMISDCLMCADLQVSGDANAIANLGGAAGINGENSTIEKVSILSGTALTGKDNAYVGGIAGMNLGTIQSCKNQPSQSSEVDSVIDCSAMYKEYFNGDSEIVAAAKNPAELDTLNREEIVSIVNGDGHTGGLVGVMGNPSNKQEGLKAVVKDSSTGRNWYVYTTAKTTDNSCGGIIGYSYATADLSGLENYALTVRTYGGGHATGGILGRWENERGVQIKMDNCKNYGIIVGVRTGGMIGQLKYNGISLNGCENWGNIYGLKDGLARCGGMIGYLFGTTAGSQITAETCGNYGDVVTKSEYAGGFIGGRQSNRPVMAFRDCVNAGNIYTVNNSQCSGFLGKDLSGSNTVFERCRNYGYGYNNLSNTEYNTKFSGISADGKLTKCFAVANPYNTDGDKMVSSPLLFNEANKNVTSGKVINSYYLGGKDEANNAANILAYEYSSPNGKAKIAELKDGNYTGEPQRDGNDKYKGSIVNGTVSTKETLNNNDRVTIETTSYMSYNASDNDPYAQIIVTYRDAQPTNGLEVHWTYRNDWWQAYIFKIGYREVDGGNVIWMKENNISHSINDKQKQCEGGLYYNKDAGIWTFYNVKTIPDYLKNEWGTEQYDKAATSYFEFATTTNVKQIVLQIYGIYRDNKNPLNGKEGTLKFPASTTRWISISELTCTGVVNSVPDPISGNSKVYGTELFWKEVGEAYEWSAWGNSLVLGAGTDKITVLPNDGANISEWNSLYGEKRWTEKINNKNGSSRKEIDEVIQQYLKLNTSVDFKPATDLEGSLKEGKIVLKWTPPKKPSQPSHYAIELKKNNTTEEAIFSSIVYDPDVKTLTIPVNETWAGETVVAYVTAYYWDVNKNNYVSTQSAGPCPIQIGAYIKTPQIRLQLDNFETEMYRVYLENYQDYVNAVDDTSELTLNVQTEGGEKIYTLYKNNGELSWRTSTESGIKSGTVLVGGGLGLIQCKGKKDEAITAFMQKGEIKTDISQVQTTALTTEGFMKKIPVANTIEFAGLSGISRNGQHYNIKKISAVSDSAGGFQNQLRGEFQVVQTLKDNNGNARSVPVVVDSALVELSEDSRNLTMEFSDLPESFDKYRVRVYPWGGKNGTALYAYYVLDDSGVKKEFTVNQLFASGGPLEGIQTKTDEISYTEELGYTLEAAGKNATGENVYYVIKSRLFDGLEGDNTIQKQQIKYADSQDPNHWISIKSRTTPENLSLKQYVFSNNKWDDESSEEDGTVKIRWEMPKSYRQRTSANDSDCLSDGEDSKPNLNSFQVILTGYESKDASSGVPIYNITCSSATSPDRYKYGWVEPQNKEGKTYYELTIPAENTTNWNYQEIGVEVICLGTENQNIVTWLPSKVKEGNPSRFVYLLPLDTISPPVIQAPEDKHTLDYVISWNGVSNNQQDYLEEYKISIHYEKDNGEKVTDDWYASLSGGGGTGRENEKKITDLEAPKVVISLDKFQGKRIEISIQALAKANQEGKWQYCDGKEGMSSSIQVPKRLPKITAVSLALGYDHAKKYTGKKWIAAYTSFLREDKQNFTVNWDPLETADDSTCGFEIILTKSGQEVYHDTVSAEKVKTTDGYSKSVNVSDLKLTNEKDLDVKIYGLMDEETFTKKGISMTAKVGDADQDSIYTGVAYVYQAGLFELDFNQYKDLVGENNSQAAGAQGVPVPADKLAKAEVNDTGMNLKLANGTKLESVKGYGTTGDGEAMTEAAVKPWERSAKLTNLANSNAAQYVIVRMRAVSDRDISSVWSDFFIMRLPKVQLETVKLTVEDREETWNETKTGITRNAKGDVTSQINEDKNQIKMQNQTISWIRENGNASAGYEVTIHPSKTVSPSNDYNNFPEVSFYISISADGKVQVKKDGIVLPPTGDNQYFLGVPEENSYVYRYIRHEHGLITELTGSSIREDKYCIEIKPYLEIEKEGDKLEFTLVLPDITNYKVDIDDEKKDRISLFATASVEVRALTQKNSQLALSGEAFAASDYSQWVTQRKGNMDNEINNYLRLLGWNQAWYESIDVDSNNEWINNLRMYSVDDSGKVLSEILLNSEKNYLYAAINRNYSWSIIRKGELNRLTAPQVNPVDAEPGKYKVEWTGVIPEQEAYLEKYMVSLTVKETGESKSLRVLSNDQDPGQPKKMSTTVDLSNYRGKTIIISVQARAKPDENGIWRYFDGLSGLVKEQYIPRILPEVQSVALSEGYSENVLESELKKDGLTLTAAVQGDLLDSSMRFKYQAGIYKLKEDQLQELLKLSSGGNEVGKDGITLPQLQVGSNGEANVELDENRMQLTFNQLIPENRTVNPSKTYTDIDAAGTEGPTFSGEKANERSLVLNDLTEEDSAQYMLIRLQTVSNKEESPWSDFYLLRLPKIQLDAVTVTENTSKETWEVKEDIEITNSEALGLNINELADELYPKEEGENGFIELSVENGKIQQVMSVNATHKALTWARKKDASEDGYRITIHPAKTEYEKNPENLPDYYSYSEYPEKYPEITFQLKIHSDDAGSGPNDLNEEPVIQIELPNGDKVNWKLNDVSSEKGDLDEGASCWEMALDQIWFDKTEIENDLVTSLNQSYPFGKDEGLWYPFGNYKYTYKYVYAREDTIKDESGSDVSIAVNETYSMDTSTWIRVIKDPNGNLSFTLILPDMETVGDDPELTILATSAVEIRAISEDGAEPSLRSQSILSVKNPLPDGSLSDDSLSYFVSRVLDTGRLWHNSISKDINYDYNWLDTFTVFGRSVVAGSWIKYSCNDENGSYQANHSPAGTPWYLTGLPFIQAGKDADQLFERLKEKIPETETQETSPQGLLSPDDEDWLILDPEEMEEETQNQEETGMPPETEPQTEMDEILIDETWETDSLVELPFEAAGETPAALEDSKAPEGQLDNGLLILE